MPTHKRVPDDSSVERVPDADNNILQSYLNDAADVAAMSAAAPDFRAALAHVREKAGPMLARLAKR